MGAVVDAAELICGGGCEDERAVTELMICGVDVV